MAPLDERPHDLDRPGVDQLQRCDLQLDGCIAARGRRRRRTRSAQLVPGAVEPPVVGRHPGAAEGVQPPHPVPEVLPQAGADLGAVARAGVVGARLPVHEAPLGHVPAEAPGSPRRGPRRDAQGLRALRAAADVGDELRRGHALHGGEAQGDQVAVPAPAAAAPGRRCLRAVGNGWHAALGARRDHRVQRAQPDVVGFLLRATRPGAHARAAAADRAVGGAGRLRGGLQTARPVQGVAGRAVDREGRAGSTRCCPGRRRTVQPRAEAPQ